MQKKIDGTVKAVEKILDTIENTGKYPQHLADIVAGGIVQTNEDTKEETIEEKLAAVGGESIDILLSKEANKEQLEIAKRIKTHNAVLVQGPPGTGKTHTIANLMGHFLAQGKSILVTSHTQKALSVLKEKMPEELQNLCVSVLDDSNKDMEQSIDGITEYMSRTTSHNLEREMKEIAEQRNKIIADLSATRHKLFNIIYKEANALVINGESISPENAARFIVDNQDELSYIPGKVKSYYPCPATFDELRELYKSNEYVSKTDEKELSFNLPNPVRLITPDDFNIIVEQTNNLRTTLKTICEKNNLVVNYKQNKITIKTNTDTITLSDFKENNFVSLKETTVSFKNIENWQLYAIIDGKKGTAYTNRWNTLINQIKDTCTYLDSIITEQFGKVITISDGTNISELLPVLEKLKNHLATKGKISKLDLVFNRSFEKVLDNIKINDKPISSSADCNLILHNHILQKKRQDCARYWDELLTAYGVTPFMQLDSREPEKIAERFIPLITKYLNWFNKDYANLTTILSECNIPSDIVFQTNILDTEVESLQKIIVATQTTIPTIADIVLTVIELQKNEDRLLPYKNILEGNCLQSEICQGLLNSLTQKYVKKYNQFYDALKITYAKKDLLQKRKEILSKIYPIAPQWATDIEERNGIHGNSIVPENIEEAWKWKQYSTIISEIIAEPFDKLQNKSLTLSKEYRKITALYAAKKAWYHLLSRTETDLYMRQALNGWKTTIKKIGKGTGKKAPQLKAEARKLMGKCQDAVPAWIMPINKALETLDPAKNKFDILIIDEASQSDISALAIAYFAQKLIIVGDDKQVSPTPIGIEDVKIAALQDTYIKDIIPNHHLYTADTSLYDIAQTTFQPLMLCEHFRCVPDIIGYSNKLSYDFKIKPLRSADNTNIYPAVVNYRVTDGKRVGKENEKEAETIIALMLACMKYPEYNGKTFGIISLLGNEQVKKIQSVLFKYVDIKLIEERKILVGNAANFQGDERDIIFLSMVDSSEDNKPLPLHGFGKGEQNRKRYNVATSRARDQLWVIHSLDTATELKPGDIRKDLLDYAANPGAINETKEKIALNSESPFENEIATALASRNYNLEQQIKVGSYRLDIVVTYQNISVAIECDGEKYHNGETQIQADMERQIILERLGWRFIRIRGSEYYSNKEKTIKRVIKELNKLGVFPESKNATTTQKQYDLLENIKLEAAEILQKMEKDKKKNPTIFPDKDIIAAALNSNDELHVTPNPINQDTPIITDIPTIQNDKKDTTNTLAKKSSKNSTTTKPTGEIKETTIVNETSQNSYVKKTKTTTTVQTKNTPQKRGLNWNDVLVVCTFESYVEKNNRYPVYTGYIPILLQTKNRCSEALEIAPVLYDEIRKCHYIFSADIASVEKNGKIICKKISEDKLSNIMPFKYKSEAILRLFDYTTTNVVIKDSQRKEVLRIVLKNKLTTKDDLINFLATLIRVKQKHPGNKTKIEKWQMDLDYVENFQ